MSVSWEAHARCIHQADNHVRPLFTGLLADLNSSMMFTDSFNINISVCHQGKFRVNT